MKKQKQPKLKQILDQMTPDQREKFHKHFYAHSFYALSHTSVPLPAPHYAGESARYKRAVVRMSTRKGLFNIAPGESITFFMNLATGEIMRSSSGFEASTMQQSQAPLCQDSTSLGTVHGAVVSQLLHQFIPSNSYKVDGVEDLNAMALTNVEGDGRDWPCHTQFAGGAIDFDIAVPNDGNCQVCMVRACDAPERFGAESNTVIHRPVNLIGNTRFDPNLCLAVQTSSRPSAHTYQTLAEHYGQVKLLMGGSSSASWSSRLNIAQEFGWAFPGFLDITDGPNLGYANGDNGYRPRSVSYHAQHGFMTIRNVGPTGNNVTVAMRGYSNYHVILPDTSEASNPADAKTSWLASVAQSAGRLAKNVYNTAVLKGTGSSKSTSAPAQERPQQSSAATGAEIATGGAMVGGLAAKGYLAKSAAEAATGAKTVATVEDGMVVTSASDAAVMGTVVPEAEAAGGVGEAILGALETVGAFFL